MESLILVPAHCEIALLFCFWPWVFGDRTKAKTPFIVLMVGEVYIGERVLLGGLLLILRFFAFQSFLCILSWH